MVKPNGKKMSITKLSETENKILDAAKKVFIQNGFAGAKMQQIADEAGINKALLHYYFRSKDKLFDIIFESELENFFTQFSNSMTTHGSFEKTLKPSMATAVKYFSENPVIPVFIINELNRNPQKAELIKNNKKLTDFIDHFKSQIESEKKENIIKDVDSIQLFTVLISLIMFPIMAKNMLKSVFNFTEEELMTMICKANVADFIINAIKK